MKKIAVPVYGVWGMKKSGDRERMPVGSLLVGLFAMVVLFAVSAGYTEAFDPADVERLFLTKQCPGCRLADAQLSHANLR